MTTLTEFLLARIADTEAEARRVAQVGSCEPAYRPAEVLAECEAKRRIVDLHVISGRGHGSCATCTDSDYLGLVDEGPCDTLRALALPYADHPAFREEWR